MLQCVAACCSALSVLQDVAVCCSMCGFQYRCSSIVEGRAAKFSREIDRFMTGDPDRISVSSKLRRPCYDISKETSYMSKENNVVATVSRLQKIIGRLCKRALLKRRYSAKETYGFQGAY